MSSVFFVSIMNANIQWFPGHMKKTLDLIRENLKLVDCVVVLLDARVPGSSKNPLISEMLKHKANVLCFNKADLADERANLAWKKYYASKGVPVAFTNAQEGSNLKELLEVVRMEITKQFSGKKRTNRRGRIMIVGIPNVGKSTLINRLVGKKVCAAGNKPGVTRGKQWLKVSNELELLDTPGVLWHKFDDPSTALHLAITGAIKDEVLQIDELALNLIEILSRRYPDAFAERYGIEVSGTPLELMEKVAVKRGFLLSGANVDYDRCANTILDEFRKGIITRVSLELPEEASSLLSTVPERGE